ncbi:LOG family protein [Rubellicoccus peritrichatus]|uniref:AMP nucleosidase n=1 Tax=Rubellicoccus peritrichatus TaxID=3080537 RepID=A0AAQ3LCK9_9BACT|nr:LOG family protein [Puniceicoccus sp. CR14]WOO41098.1 LOG family protein [Puniceicoccus sp. CR14]
MPEGLASDHQFDLVGQAVENILEMQPEFIKTAIQLERENVRQTVVFFGAAKVLSPENAQAELDALELRFKQIKRRTKKHWQQLDQAADGVYMSRYYQAAEDLAAKITLWSKTRGPKKELVIATGAGPGIMEAANKGAFTAGGRSAGFGIEIPTEQKPNEYITPELLFYFKSFLPRKFWLIFPARALVVFPGGIGTLDELFEVYTLMKTRKATRYIPIVLYGREYWEELINFDTMVRFGTIHKSDLDFISFCDSVDEAFDFITNELEKQEAAKD